MTSSFHRMLIIAFFLLLGSNAVGAVAEVVTLTSGELLFCSIGKESSNSLTVTCAGGKKIELVKSDILRQEKSYDYLLGQTLFIKLVNGSVIHGQLVEYDDELGVFLEIPFGTLDLPLKHINQIYLGSLAVEGTLTDLSTQVIGSFPASVYLNAGATIVVPVNSSLFGISYAPNCAFGVRIPGVHGLYAEETIDFLVLSYSGSSEVSWYVADLCFGVRADLLAMLSASDTVRAVSPYISVCGGPAFVRLIDRRATASNRYYGTINGTAKASVGVEFFPVARFSFNIDARFGVITQNGKPLLYTGGNLGVRYRL